MVGLELGADDYVVKPFGLRELVARIRAVRGGRSRAPARTRRRCASVGALEVDLRAHRATPRRRRAAAHREGVRPARAARARPGRGREPRADPRGGLGHDLVRLREDDRRPRRLAPAQARRSRLDRDGARRRPPPAHARDEPPPRQLHRAHAARARGARDPARDHVRAQRAAGPDDQGGARRGDARLAREDALQPAGRATSRRCAGSPTVRGRDRRPRRRRRTGAAARLVDTSPTARRGARLLDPAGDRAGARAARSPPACATRTRSAQTCSTSPCPSHRAGDPRRRARSRIRPRRWTTRVRRYWLVLAAIAGSCSRPRRSSGSRSRAGSRGRCATSSSRGRGRARRARHARAGGGAARGARPRARVQRHGREAAAAPPLRRRQFVADASHQLRTPLTALRLRLENLERDVSGRGPRVARRRAAPRWSGCRALVDGLLALARSDASERAAGPLDLATLVRVTGGGLVGASRRARRAARDARRTSRSLVRAAPGAARAGARQPALERARGRAARLGGSA